MSQKTVSPDEFSEKILSKHQSPFEDEKFSDTYKRTFMSLIQTGECSIEEAKLWTATSLYKHLESTGVLRSKKK